MSIKQISKETILNQLNWRYAVKKFDAGKKISEEDWEILEQSLILAPSSFGLQPYKFIVVKDEELKEKLRPAAWGQTQITDSSHLVVIAYKKVLAEKDVEDFIELTSKTRGMPHESLADYENVIKNSAKNASENGTIETWNSRQAYIALGFLLETAALLGIDACPMEGFDAAQFDKILGLEDYSAVALCALGYRDSENDWLAPLAKVRFPKDELIEVR
ncbi:MAG TPA: NAD(P)H-dependent oxidoreductase [Pyrinomonadaceae bacterium]|jgi:nitroreductase